MKFKFIENLVKNLPKSEQETYKAELLEEINERMGICLMENLTDEDRSIIEQYQDNHEKLQEFVNASLTKYKDVLNASLVQFMKEYSK